MIVTELYDGQGLGNQLWCYAVTRAIAKKNGYDFGIMSTNRFKGRDFMELDFGNPNSEVATNHYIETLIRHPNGDDISLLDKNLLNVGDNTKVDGVMQDEMYLYDIKDEVINWLKINYNKNITDYSANDICVIHVRGGDFRRTQAVLNGSYYLTAVNKMKTINENMKFVVVTDDVGFVRSILPGFEIVGGSVSGALEKTNARHHMGGPIYMDYSILNNAKYVIMGASSFAWWAVWTNKSCKYVIAPKYWARHRTSDGYWSTGGSITRGWYYLSKEGKIFTSEECITEYKEYKKNSKLWG